SVKESIDKALLQYESTIRTDRQRQIYAAVAPARATWLAALNAGIAASNKSKPEEARVLSADILHQQAEPAFAKFMASVQALTEYNQADGQAGGAEVEAAISSVNTGVLVGIAVAIALGSFVSL